MPDINEEVQGSDERDVLECALEEQQVDGIEEEEHNVESRQEVVSEDEAMQDEDI